jgi:hypothetical protein
MSHDLAIGINGSGNQFAMTRSFVPAATMVVVYTCRKSHGFMVLSYYMSMLGQNLVGHVMRQSRLE